MGQISIQSSSSEAKKIRLGLEINYKTLTLFPILMEYYEEFAKCQGVWCLAQNTLPAEYQELPFISALLKFDINASNKGQPSGFLYRILLMLGLALRLDNFNFEFIGENFNKEVDTNEIGIYFKLTSNYTLDKIIITQSKEKREEITPKEFQDLRNKVAKQNGFVLSDSSKSIKYQREGGDKENKNKNNLDTNVNTLISSVAYLSGISEKDINEWTILQFGNRCKAIERDKNYMMHRQAELSGFVKFDKGNPFQSWCYDNKKDFSKIETLDSLAYKFSMFGDLNSLIDSQDNK